METWEVELNEKLARWAGFVKAVETPRSCDCGEPLPYWQDSNGRNVEYRLNFTESLDLCFKWLVPKVISMGLRCEWGTASKVNSFSIHDEWGRLYAAAHCDRGKGELDALALCRAIEQMIELEVK